MGKVPLGNGFTQTPYVSMAMQCQNATHAISGHPQTMHVQDRFLGSTNHGVFALQGVYTGYTFLQGSRSDAGTRPEARIAQGRGAGAFPCTGFHHFYVMYDMALMVKVPDSHIPGLPVRSSLSAIVMTPHPALHSHAGLCFCVLLSCVFHLQCRVCTFAGRYVPLSLFPFSFPPCAAL